MVIENDFGFVGNGVEDSNDGFGEGITNEVIGGL